MKPNSRQKTGMIISILSAGLLLCGCPKAPPKPEAPSSFPVAIRLLSHRLLNQIKSDSSMFRTENRIVIDPFIDAHTREEPEVSKKIENIFKDTGKEFPGFSLDRLQTENLADADYVISGMIRLGHFPYSGDEKETDEKKKLYQVLASARDIRSGDVIGSSDIWISDLKLGEYKPKKIYQDSPLYDIVGKKDPLAKGEEITAKLEEEPKDEEAYRADLELRALLTEAGDAYNRKDYKISLEKYKKIAELPNGDGIRTYAGLYMANLRMGKMKAAKEAFTRLIDISVKKYGKLTVKFTFKVNSVEFWNDPFLKKQYRLWLEKMGEYFAKSPECMKIVGHCSKSGTEEWNDKLSKMRAERILQYLQRYSRKIRKRSKPMGKGFRENIIGIGTDDERDALDRRVEFILTPCDKN